MILFSGGKDSLLATVRLLDEGYHVYLVNYENSCGIQSNNVEHTINRLIKKYGNEKVTFLGVKNISAIWREFIYPYYNFKVNEIFQKYGNISISQFNCLTCRLAMYVATILTCQSDHINIVVDGARKSQLFAIEQKELLNRFGEFFRENGIKIEFPLQDMQEDYEVKNELLMRGIVPKTLEPQCLLGIPLKDSEIDNEIILAVCNVYDKYLKEKAMCLLKRYKGIELTGEFV